MTALLLLSAGTSSLAYSNDPLSSSRVLCKYSVRDVGFVEVHSFGWQLTLAKPGGISDTELKNLDDAIDGVLKGTNLSRVWVSTTSPDWNSKIAQTGFSSSPDQAEPVAILSNSKGEHFAVQTPGNRQPKIDSLREYQSDLVSVLERIVDSPIRSRILKSCSQSLCVLLMVESGIPEKDNAARKLQNNAIQQIGKQMWELEKPTESAPVAEIVEAQQRLKEQWLLNSLGLGAKEKNSDPVFVILYGRARRLGATISLKDAELANLVGRMAVCGGDCECELDRDWLYGHQAVIRWSRQLDQLLDRNLDFDPHAAYVRSEVAAIVRKSIRSSGKASTEKIVDLGPGLIIHDLEAIESKLAEKSVEKPVDQHNSSETADTPTTAKTPDREISTDDQNRVEETSSSASEEGLTGTPSVPFSLIFILIAIIGLIFFFSMMRGN